MEESQEFITPPISKRTVLKAGAAGILAGLTGKVAVSEVHKALEGFFEYDGVQYLPLYEQHDTGPEVSLPDSTDGIFRELVAVHKVVETGSKGEITLTEYDHFTMAPNQLAAQLTVYNGQEVPSKKALNEKIKKLQIPIAVGDIEGKDDIGRFFDAIVGDRGKFEQGIKTILFSSIPETARQIVKKVNPSLTRRAFMKGVAGLTMGAAAVGGVKGLELVSDDIDQFVGEETGSPVVNRLLTRLHGVGSHLHPQEPQIFVRNAVMALKIKNLAEEVKKAKDHPLIAYSVGKLHAGIEDFICLPADVLRNIIVFANNTYIKEAEEKYGEKIATTRQIKADESGVYHNLPDIVDIKLLDMLQKSG